MLDFLGSLNPYLAIIVSAFVPILEKGSIPLALGVYHLSIPVTFIIVVVVSTFVPLLILPLLGQIVSLLKKIHPKVEALINHVLTSHYKHHAKSFDRWGALALAIFVAIPTPITGPWTATLLAYIFGIPLRLAVLGIGAGSVISTIILIGITLGGLQLLR